MMLSHKGTQKIKTPRLTLRRFTMDDVPAVYSNWASDSEVTEFLRWPAHTHIGMTMQVLDRWISDYARSDFYHWTIVPDDLGEPVGSISAVGHDDRTSMAHIGYCLGKAWWHLGYMSESLAAVIEFFFTQVGINRIESQHDPRNPNSGGVMKKCGMVYEGTKRQADFSNKGIADACMYSILRSEWSDKQ